MTKGRLVTIALVASLAVNGLLGGYIFERWLSAPEPEAFNVAAEFSRVPAGEASMRDVLTELADRLPEEDRRILREAVDANDERLATATGSLTAPRAQIAQLLLEPEVDEDALRAALGEVRANRLSAVDIVIEILADTLPRMSRPTRARIALAIGAR